METKELIKEIQRLPVRKQKLIVEWTLKAIKERELKDKMKKAVDVLQDDYRTDKELTVFTKIDFDNFYETR